jgi:hypothetical protein
LYDLPSLDKRLKEEPEQVIACAFPRSEAALRARGPLQPDMESVEFTVTDSGIEQLRTQVIDTGQRAVSKLLQDGENAALDQDEIIALEAIIHIERRPAILIQDGRFFPPPPEWEVLEHVRENIETTIRSVGRIEVSGHPRLDWIGTGFLVADDIIMTNRHVAKAFADWGERGQWKFEPGIEARIDYAEEFSTPAVEEFSITDIVGIIDWPGPDLALLRVSRRSPQGIVPPEPLRLAAEVPEDLSRREVYVLGFPAWDPFRNDPEVMRRIFANIYGVKRLQPGWVENVFRHDTIFTHDCSTLGGNSGSCVVDLETNLVIGLHYSGRYLEANKAVALWMLRDSPLLKRANVYYDSISTPPKPAPGYDARVGILDVQLSEVPRPPGVWQKELMAQIKFEVSGQDAQKLTDSQAAYRVEVHIVNQAGGVSSLVASEQQQLRQGTFNYTSQQKFRMPGVGHYELHSIVLLLPPADLMERHQGPVFRVV